VALQCLPGTELVFTLMGGLTSLVKGIASYALRKRRRIACISFPQPWHLRLNGDPRHGCLREAMRLATAALTVNQGIATA